MIKIVLLFIVFIFLLSGLAMADDIHFKLLELADDIEGHRRIVERNIVNADALQYDFSLR